MDHSCGVMWKTVSEACNLACDYCYYSSCGGRPGPAIDRIDDRLLEAFVKNRMELSRGAASFAWQGGEPLLAGLAFFERVVELQAKHAPPRTAISNSLQTNGTLINDKRAAFFKAYNFLIGVSLDGPRAIHDMRRVDGAGQGSYDRVMNGIRHLRRHRVDFNILTVIHRGNVDKAEELLAFYKRERFDYVQFIPCMDFRSQDVDAPGVYEVTPEQYGRFLGEAFDIWYNGGRPALSIRFFDNLLSVYAHREAELCTQRGSCPQTLVLERNGDAYPCDFYIHDDWKLGNAGTDSIEKLLSSPVYARFLELKPALPDACRSCEWQRLCHGGCPRNRFWHSDGSARTDYFCSGYRTFFAHAHERMTLLGDAIRKQWFRRGLAAVYNGKQPGRNEPCPCGSGRKYKQCCVGISV